MSPKCDVNPQPNTQGIGPLVIGRTSGNRRSVMHVLAAIFSITYHFFFICQYIFIQVILSGRETHPLLMYPSTFLVFKLTTKIQAVSVVASLPSNQSRDVKANIPIGKCVNLRKAAKAVCLLSRYH